MSKQRGIIYFLLFLTIGFYCLDYFFRISPSLVLPELIKQYHSTPLGMGIFASAFYLGYVIFQIPGGYLLDRYCLKFPIAIIVVLCTLCFIGFIFADQFYLGVVLRFLIGATSAISFIGVLYVARRYLPVAWLPFISGVTIAIGTCAASVIQTANAYLMQWFNWHETLTVFSLWGILIAALILLLPICGLRVETDTTPPNRHIVHNLIEILKNRRLLYNGFIGGLFYLPTSLLTAVWGITYFKASYGVSSTAASTAIFMVFLGWAIGSPIIGLVGGLIRFNRTLVIIPALLAAVSSYFLLFEATQMHAWFFPLCFLFGLFSSAQVMVWKNFNGLCSIPLTGLGIAATNMAIMIVVTVAHSVIGALINAGYKNHQHLSASVVLSGLKWIPILFIAVAVLTVFNHSTKKE